MLYLVAGTLAGAAVGAAAFGFPGVVPGACAGCLICAIILLNRE